MTPELQSEIRRAEEEINAAKCKGSFVRGDMCEMDGLHIARCWRHYYAYELAARLADRRLRLRKLTALRAEVVKAAAEQCLEVRVSPPSESPDDINMFGVWLLDEDGEEDLVGSGVTEEEALTDALETIKGWEPLP